MSKKKEFKAAVTRLQQTLSDSFVDGRGALLEDLKTVSVYASELSTKVQTLETQVQDLQRINEKLKAARQDYNLARQTLLQALEQCEATYNSATKRLLVESKRLCQLLQDQVTRRPVKFGALQTDVDDVNSPEVQERRAHMHRKIEVYAATTVHELRDLDGYTIELRHEDWGATYQPDELLLFGMLIRYLCDKQHVVILRPHYNVPPVNEIVDIVDRWVTLYRMPTKADVDLTMLVCALKQMPEEARFVLKQIVRSQFRNISSESGGHCPPPYPKAVWEAAQKLLQQWEELNAFTLQELQAAHDQAATEDTSVQPPQPTTPTPDAGDRLAPGDQ